MPHPVISTVTHGATAECVQWRNLYRLFMNVKIPPLRMLRCRSACFGRNDGRLFVIASLRSNPEGAEYQNVAKTFHW